jgi:hypothetical protein
MPENPFIEQAVPDPVFSNFDLPLRRTFYALGFPLELETNSEDVIQAAQEGWGAFTQTFAEAPVRLSVAVAESDSGAALPVQSTIHARGHLMSIIANRENFAVCDFDQGYAFAWVTRRVAADHPLLRYRFLTSAGTTLVEQRALASLHGALIVRNGSGVMLCGDSFAGKSTLAYAAARVGWTFVSDDGTHLVRSRCDRYAMGDPYTIRFRDDAPGLFPELAERMPVIRPNGKIAIEIFTRELPIVTAPGCVIDHLVFLNRDQPGSAHLRRLDKQRVAESWQDYASFGAERTRAAQRECYQRLLDADCWELDYSSLDDAIARLERLVDSGG